MIGAEPPKLEVNKRLVRFAIETSPSGRLAMSVRVQSLADPKREQTISFDTDLPRGEVSYGRKLVTA